MGNFLDWGMQKLTTLLALFILLNLMGQPLKAQFVQISSPTTYQLEDIHFPSPQVGYMVGDSGTVIKSTNGGNSWVLLGHITTRYLQVVRFFDEQTGIVAALNDSLLYRTTDGGATWQSIPGLTSWGYSHMVISGPGEAYLSANPAGIYKTTDSGATWTLINNNFLPGTGGLLDYVHDSLMFGAQFGGSTFYEMFKSTDGGVNWDTITFNPSGFITILEAIHFFDENEGITAGWYNPHLIYTTDGGTTWEGGKNGDTLFWAQLVDMSFLPGSDAGYAVGWHGTALYTANRGHDWEFVSVPTTTHNYFKAVYFINDSVGWIAGDGGVILMTTNGGGVNVEPNLPDLDFEVYPNPSAGNFRIEIPAEEKGVEITLRDVRGRLIEHSPFKREFSLENTEAGIYFLEVRTEEKRGIRRIMVAP